MRKEHSAWRPLLAGTALPGFHRLHDSLINFFYDYLPLPCSLALTKDMNYWHPMSIPQRGMQSSYFEIRFGRRQQRRDYNLRHQARAAKGQGPVLGSHAGMHDLFIPIVDQGKTVAWVVLGSFQARLPGRDLCWAQWKALRRVPDADDASDFLLYVRSRLDTPVIEAPLRKALIPVLRDAGAALLGLSSALAAADGLDRLKSKVVTHRTPWRMWHFTESKRDRLNFDQGPYEPHEVMPWDAEEFGLRRAPDTVLAFCPRDPGADAATALAQTGRLQEAVFDLCQQRPGLVAGRSGGEAALVLAALDKGVQADNLARDLQRHLAGAMGATPHCSWAGQPRKPEELANAIYRAEGGLRLALAQGRSLVEAPAAVDEGQALESLESLSQEMAQAWSQGRVEAARLAMEKVVAAALKASSGRSEILKLNLRWCLAPLILRLQLRGAAASGASGQAWRREISPALDSAPSSRELVQRFAVLVESLGQRLLQPLTAERRQLLRQALQSLEALPESDQGLEGLARDLGLSSSRVSRLLKAGSGSGYVKARTQARLAKAKRLLAASPLSLANIASECGWVAQAHFSRVFKEQEGLSPREYRKKNQIKSNN